MHSQLFRILFKLAETCELGKALTTGDWNVYNKSEHFCSFCFTRALWPLERRKPHHKHLHKSQPVNSILWSP